MGQASDPQSVLGETPSPLEGEGRDGGGESAPPTLFLPSRGEEPYGLHDDQIRSDTACPGRTPTISRLMALAIKYEGLIRDGIVLDYADLARLGFVTRARMTQVMSLLNPAPDIQEEILTRSCAKTQPGVNQWFEPLLSKIPLKQGLERPRTLVSARCSCGWSNQPPPRQTGQWSPLQVRRRGNHSHTASPEPILDKTDILPVPGRPGPLGAEPSYFLAMRVLYQRRRVSGVTMLAI